MTTLEYYTELVDFAGVFKTGRPVLTYHHVGPRPARVRIKGLYVSPGLFARQMRELRQADYAAPRYTVAALQGPLRPKEIFLTFDDGFVDVFRHALPVLKEHGWSAIQFLVSDLIGKTNEWQVRMGDAVEPLMDEAQVREWLAAGQAIGAHTRTHPRLTRIPLATAREEIAGSRKAIEDRFGVPVEHFCYPFGDWNEAVRDLVIEAGYKSACTTISGVNPVDTSLFELKRFTARYASRNWAWAWRNLKRCFGQP